MSDKLSIAFQGTKSGLVIAIDDALPFQTMMKKLSRKLSESGDFFTNAEVTLNLGCRAVTEVDLQDIRQTVQRVNGLQITAIKSASPETLATAELLGLPGIDLSASNRAPRKSVSRNGKASVQHRADFATLPTELLRKTLRSGQIYESRSNIVILGDVNAGAEVISAGDIVVFGALRGIAHAGATGNEESMILALKLRPTQLRIASRIARADDSSGQHSGPALACIENEQIVIDQWRGSSYFEKLVAQRT